MRSTLSSLTNLFRKAFLVLALVCSLSIFSGFAITTQPSYAASGSTLADPAASLDDREEAYEEAAEVAKDPKMGTEKEYEKEMDVYFDEHPGEGGIVGGVKSLVDKATDSK